MPNRQDTSIFDVIGPIMVGPSSSHTAGAVRLGWMGRNLLGDTPQRAQIGLHGSFAETGAGHGTPMALVAGLLGMGPSDPHIRNSQQIAVQQGRHIEFSTIDLGDDAHPNSVHMILSSASETVELTGASVGGGLIEVTRIGAYEVRVSGLYDTLLILAEDRPGTITKVTGLLAEQSINVAFLKVERDQRGGKAMMIIETDHPIEAGHIEAVHQLAWVQWVRRLPRLED